MAPSEKTALRRVQRAGQRQRMRDALAKASEAEAHTKAAVAATSTSSASAPVSKGAPPAEGVAPVESSKPQCRKLSHGDTQAVLADTMSIRRISVAEAANNHAAVFVDALLTAAVPSQTMTAEEFAEKVCQLVDTYRAGLKHERNEPLQDLALHSAVICGSESRSMACSNRCDLDEGRRVQEAVPEPRCSGGRPMSPRSRPYTVRNTFIDVLPNTAETSDSQKAIFSTWPEDKPTVPQEKLYSDPTLSHHTGVPPTQLEAGEILEDLEEGELLDEEEPFCDLSESEVCAFSTGNWQSNYDALQPQQRYVATCEVTSVDDCAKAASPAHLEIPTKGVNELLTQSFGGCDNAAWASAQLPSVSIGHGGRWRKNNAEPKEGCSTTCDSESSEERGSGSTTPRCVLSLESALIGSQHPGWFDVQPQVPWMPYA